MAEFVTCGSAMTRAYSLSSKSFPMAGGLPSNGKAPTVLMARTYDVSIAYDIGQLVSRLNWRMWRTCLLASASQHRSHHSTDWAGVRLASLCWWWFSCGDESSSDAESRSSSSQRVGEYGGGSGEWGCVADEMEIGGVLRVVEVVGV
jgi:hypothetical protein